MRHRQDQGTRPPLDGLEPDGESLAPEGRQEGRNAPRAVGKPRSAEGRRVQASRDLVRANRSAHPDQHQSWLDGIVWTPRLRVETQPPARPLRQHPAMPVGAHPALGAHQRPGQASSDPRNGARPAAAARARPRYRRDARDRPRVRVPCFVSHASHPQALASQSPSRHSSPTRPSRGPLPCRRSGHATNAAARPAPARTPDRSCSAPADRRRATAAPPCPPARDRPPRRGSRRRPPAPPRLRAATADRPADLRDARGSTRHWPRSRSIPAADPAPAPAPALRQAAGRRAADAAVGQPQHLPGAVRQQARVHVHRPEVVHQHRRAPRPAPAHGSAAWSCPRQETADHGQRDASAPCAVHLRRPEAIGRPPTTVPHTPRPSGARPADRDHPPARRSRHACQPRWSRPDDPCAAYRPRPA